MTKERAHTLLSVYERAWVTKDPELILTIFTPDALYHDPHEPKNSGRDAIRSYWKNKVVNGQRDIEFELEHLWLDGDTVIAEWSASFTDTIRNLRIAIREIGVFESRGELFSSLREYYTTLSKEARA